MSIFTYIYNINLTCMSSWLSHPWKKPKDFSNFPLPPWKVSTNFRHFQVVQVYGFLTQQLIIITVWINPKKYVAWVFFAWIWLIGWFMIWLFFQLSLDSRSWFHDVSWFHQPWHIILDLKLQKIGFPWIPTASTPGFFPCEHGTLALIKGSSSCKWVHPCRKNPG